jgi:rhodanese-related sulfurtransferase
MSALTVIIDPGNFSTKYVYRWKNELQVGTFESIAHRYEEMEQSTINEAKRVTFKRFDYFIGRGAAHFHTDESTMYRGNKRKGHHEGIIRIVAALHDIHKATGATTFNVVSTSPYTSMIKDREFFERQLGKEIECVVDGKEFNFVIENFRTAAEGMGALKFSETKDCVVLDAGSMTLNVLYFINGTINATRSKTLNGGTIENDTFALADIFSRAVSSTVEYDKYIIVTGGRSVEVAEALEDIGYDNVHSIELKDHPPYYANVVGIFLIFEKKFEKLFAAHV